MKPEILIVGGGIAGLALASYLKRQGRKPLIVEQAPEWRDQGYGIGLWKEGLRVLDELGCLETARRQAADPETFAIRSSGGKLLSQVQVPRESTALLAIYRGDLHAALREARFEAGVMFLDSAPLRWLRDKAVQHTPLMKLFMQSRLASSTE